MTSDSQIRYGSGVWPCWRAAGLTRHGMMRAWWSYHAKSAPLIWVAASGVAGCVWLGVSRNLYVLCQAYGLVFGRLVLRIGKKRGMKSRVKIWIKGHIKTPAWGAAPHARV